MTIKFLCPNGHKIHCPDEQAGRAAKCPHCGVKFRVPAPSPEPPPSDGSSISTDESETPQTVAEEPEPEPEREPEPAPPPPPRQPAGEDHQIEFLCPNGHRLHGPASLQGRPGQCPDCGSRFRVPRYDDVSEEEDFEQEISSGRADGANSDVPARGVHAVSQFGDPVDGMDYEMDLDAGERSAPAEEPEAGPADEDPNPWVRLLGRLWAQKTAGVVVELCLQDGETIVPERFARGLSQRGHGVFAVKNSNGTYTVTAVPWAAVSRLHVRGVKSLPEELFG